MGLLARMHQTAPRADITSSADLMRLLTAQQVESEAGETVTMDSALRAAAVFACVRVITEDIGKLPCILYRRLKNGGRERATDHPVYALLRRRPNGWMTPSALFALGQAFAELTGNGDFFITRGTDGRPLELLPIGGRVRVEQDAQWRVRYWVTNRTGGEREVAPNQILSFSGLSIDGLRGLSTIGYARETIGSALAAERHGARFFKNSARPSLVIERPKDAPSWTRDAAERFVESMKEKWGGSNSSTIGLLEEGMTAKALTISSKDAQFIESRNYNRTEIAGLFRVGPHKIGDLSRSTNNNIEHQGLEHLTDCLLPRLVRNEQALNRALLTDAEQEDYYVEFLVDSIARADLKTRMEAYAVSVQNGFLSPNEVRLKENEGPRDGGDAFWRPANMVSSDAPEPVPPPTP
jgi:HK97 family phage portal protein